MLLSNVVISQQRAVGRCQDLCCTCTQIKSLHTCVPQACCQIIARLWRLKYIYLQSVSSIIAFEYSCYQQCRSAFMSSGCQPNFLKYVCTPRLHPFIILRTLQSSRGLYRKEVQRTPAARSSRATLTMVKQRMTTADVAGEVACLRQRGVLGMRGANLYDLNSKVLSAYTQIQQ